MVREILLAVLEIFGLFAVGWLACHVGHIREEDLFRWSRLVIDFLFPLLVFHTIVSRFEPERLAELWPLPLLGFGVMAVGALLGAGLRCGLSSGDLDVRRTFHHLCAINNYGFLPIILVQNLWGQAALAELFFLNLGSSVGYWTIGVGLLGGSNARETARNILSPPLVALLLALALSITGLSAAIPDLLMRISSSAGSAAVPVLLVLIGASMHRAPLGSDRRDLAYLTFVRLVLLPCVTILILKALPLSDDVHNIALVVSLMPAASSSTILARRYGGSPTFAAAAVVVTTAVSLLTIPIGCWLLR